MARPVTLDLGKDDRRKLLFRSKELRDLLQHTERTLMDLFNDPFTGWPYLLLFGLRYQNNRLTLDDCCDLIDRWAELHKEEAAPLKGLGVVLMDAINASGLVKLEAEGAKDPNLGNEEPAAAHPLISGDQ